MTSLTVKNPLLSPMIIPKKRTNKKKGTRVKKQKKTNKKKTFKKQGGGGPNKYQDKTTQILLNLLVRIYYTYKIGEILKNESKNFLIGEYKKLLDKIKKPNDNAIMNINEKIKNIASIKILYEIIIEEKNIEEYTNIKLELKNTINEKFKRNNMFNLYNQLFFIFDKNKISPSNGNFTIDDITSMKFRIGLKIPKDTIYKGRFVYDNKFIKQIPEVNEKEEVLVNIMNSFKKLFKPKETQVDPVKSIANIMFNLKKLNKDSFDNKLLSKPIQNESELTPMVIDITKMNESLAKNTDSIHNEYDNKYGFFNEGILIDKNVLYFFSSFDENTIKKKNETLFGKLIHSNQTNKSKENIHKNLFMANQNRLTEQNNNLLNISFNIMLKTLIQDAIETHSFIDNYKKYIIFEVPGFEQSLSNHQTIKDIICDDIIETIGVDNRRNVNKTNKNKANVSTSLSTRTPPNIDTRGIHENIENFLNNLIKNQNQVKTKQYNK